MYLDGQLLASMKEARKRQEVKRDVLQALEHLINDDMNDIHHKHGMRGVYLSCDYALFDSVSPSELLCNHVAKRSSLPCTALTCLPS
jgi:hypothetical protein